MTSTLPPFLHPFTKPTRQQFISIARGEGAALWDADGNEYIDAMASLWYCAVGHGRREIADAVANQIGTIEAYSCFDPVHQRAGRPARREARDADRDPRRPGLLLRVGFGSRRHGDEAGPPRPRAWPVHPERTLIISRARGYHGTNFGGTSAQGIAPNREGWGPLVGDVLQVPGDDVEALSVLMTERGHEVAAVLTEPVQGAGGVFPPTEGYLADVRRLCDQHGALLIFDEVITGFGRLGTWFAAHRYGVTPDLTTFAKAVTSGYQPLGGVFVGAAVRQALESDSAFLLRHGYTYSGHTSACAAGVVNLDIIEREGLIDAAKRVGARLGDGLTALAADGVIDHARGDGAVWAAGLRPDQDAMKVRDRMLELGVITRAIGTDTCTFCPPFVTTDAQVDRIVDTLATACT